MVKFRMMAVGVALAVTGCNGADTGPAVSATGPAVAAPPAEDAGEIPTPNSFPPSSLIGAPIAPETGVVGVRHLPP